VALQPLAHVALQPLAHVALQPLATMALQPLAHMALQPLAHVALQPLAHVALQPLATMAKSVSDIGMESAIEHALVTSVKMGLRQTKSIVSLETHSSSRSSNASHIDHQATARV
jgi:hypothetical protein